MLKYIILLFIASSTYSQVTLEWSKTHNDTITSSGTSTYYSLDEPMISCYNNGKIYVCGVSSVNISPGTHKRTVTIAYDENGNILWKRNFPELYEFGIGYLRINSINTDHSGNIILSGAISNRPMLIKYSSTGERLWVKDSSEQNLGSSPYSFVSVPDMNGNIFLAYRKGVNSSWDIYLKKFSPEGNLLWEKNYNGSENKDDYPLCITTDHLGNVIVGGYENSLGPGHWGKYCVLKYSPSGNLLWNKTYSETFGQVVSLAVDNNDNVYTAGSLLINSPNHEIISIKYSPNGDQIWVSRYSGRPEYVWNETKDMNIDNNGNMYITGFTEKGYPYCDFVTLKYNSGGILQWASYYNPPYDHVDVASSISYDDNGNVYVTGLNSLSSGTCSAVLKYNSSGVQQWDNTINSDLPFSTSMYPTMSISNGSVFIFGAKRFSNPSNTDYLLTKLQQVIGITNISSNIPAKYSIEQNYPNPFNPITNIKFDIVKSGLVKINIYDVLGRNTVSLVNQQMNPGSYKVDWDASAYPSGVYFYKLEAGEFTQTRKMVLVK